MSVPTRLATAALAGCLLAGGTAVVVAPAQASGGSDDRVIQTGPCSGAARWKLKVKTDDGSLEVEGEVDSNTAGQSWSWTIADNGVVVARGNARTAGRSGSFSVERKIANRGGTDRVVFTAKRANGSSSCVGRIAF